MTKDPAKLKQRLLALGSSSERAVARRMADVLPEIEFALRAGASRSAVVQALNDEGIPVTLSTFATNLYRLRKAAGTVAIAPAEPAPSSPARPSPLATPDSPEPTPPRLREIMQSRPDLGTLAKLGRAAARSKASKTNPGKKK